MRGRSRTRSQKGGDSLSVPDGLNELENSLKSIQSDVNLALEKVKSLGENIQSKEEEERRRRRGKTQRRRRRRKKRR
jgi:hypothetical protein